jgi:hypothetical protein
MRNEDIDRYNRPAPIDHIKECCVTVRVNQSAVLVLSSPSAEESAHEVQSVNTQMRPRGTGARKRASLIHPPTMYMYVHASFHLVCWGHTNSRLNSYTDSVSEGRSQFCSSCTNTRTLHIPFTHVYLRRSIDSCPGSG